MLITRRGLFASAAAIAAGAPPSARRSFHFSVAPEALEADPELIDIVRRAGVTDLWISGFLYGHWYYTPERIARVCAQARRAGLAAHVINVPLGHPGDSLGAVGSQPPLIPPPHWKQGIRHDGRKHWGNSLHHPATQENADAIRRIQGIGVQRAFLDDDFRLAQGPGVIGGCVCDQHIEEFRRRGGYGPSVREELAEAARRRNLTPVLRAWVEFTSDQLTACFRAIKAAAPRVDLGIMVMYLGAEKAGIRLADYRGVPFRVGELMFSDREFQPVKGKTDELFSALFHRRFVEPHLAFSETTAFPSDKLSAANMAAKLAVSTLADVRNTMFMSGITPIKRTYWETLGPAMRRHAAIHAKVAGHTPHGPFKHWWGEGSRYVGDDKPYSLFLAAGVPFQVCAQPPGDGWMFASDHDAGPRRITRRDTPETLADLFTLKRRILPQLSAVPYVEDEKPVVCSWLPTAHKVLLWSLAGQRETFSLMFGGHRRQVAAGPLELVAVDLA